MGKRQTHCHSSLSHLPLWPLEHLMRQVNQQPCHRNRMPPEPVPDHQTRVSSSQTASCMDIQISRIQQEESGKMAGAPETAAAAMIHHPSIQLHTAQDSTQQCQAICTQHKRRPQGSTHDHQKSHRLHISTTAQPRMPSKLCNQEPLCNCRKVRSQQGHRNLL